MRTLTITLPLPPRCLSPNARPHYHQKAKAAKDCRRAAHFACLALLPGGYRPRFRAGVRRVEWFSKTARRPDYDNASAMLKNFQDGIVDSGFLADDKHLRPEPIEFRVDRQKPRVVITIEATE